MQVIISYTRQLDLYLAFDLLGSLIISISMATRKLLMQLGVLWSVL